jgi:hypothetical protein
VKYKLYSAPEYFDAYEKGFEEGRKREREEFRNKFDLLVREFRRELLIDDLQKEWSDKI